MEDQKLRHEIANLVIDLYKGQPAPDSKKIKSDLETIYNFIKNGTIPKEENYTGRQNG